MILEDEDGILITYILASLSLGKTKGSKMQKVNEWLYCTVEPQ